MRKICIINQKGGVGKTTTAVNVAAGLSRKGKRVLLIDLDPQGNIADSLTANRVHTVYDFIVGNCAGVDCTTNLGKNLDLIHSTEKLTKIDQFLLKQQEPQKVLKERFEELSNYDYVILDCAPSLGVLNQNVMLYASEALIPVATTHLSAIGMKSIISAIDHMNDHFNHNLEVKYIVPTLHDVRNKSNKEVLSGMHTTYDGKITNAIRVNNKLSIAPKHGMSIFSYDKTCRGAKDYDELVEHVLKTAPAPIGSVPISMRVQKMMAHVSGDDW
jgi:chromosome partitioning protein